MATTIRPAVLERPAVPIEVLDLPARRARAVWRQAFALITTAGGCAVALYRRWDAHQERIMHVAAERDNVHLLFPRI